jgi:hypothetical protein
MLTFILLCTTVLFFWGNSSYAINIFRLQKRVIRIMTGTRNRSSCRQLFITLRILPLQSIYIYSLLCFVVSNMDEYQFISEVHNRNTRQGVNFNLYQPSAHLSIYQKGTHYMGIKYFKSALKDFFIVSLILYPGGIS